jgi:hypothetical protein
MNVQHTRTAVAESRERPSYARVPRHWLLLARGLWITLVTLTLAIFFASLPVYIAQLQTPCAGTTCAYEQLTLEQAEMLKGLGLSPGDYAAYTVAFTLALRDIMRNRRPLSTRGISLHLPARHAKAWARCAPPLLCAGEDRGKAS